MSWGISMSGRGFCYRYQVAWSTIIAACIGFGGLSLATYLGFEQNRLAQVQQWEATRNAYELEKRREAEILAVALLAEFSAAWYELDNFVKVAPQLYAIWEETSSDAKNNLLTISVAWKFKFKVYEANLTRLGLLPASLTDDIVYWATTIQRESDSEDMLVEHAPGRIKAYEKLARSNMKGIQHIKFSLSTFISDDECAALEC